MKSFLFGLVIYILASSAFSAQVDCSEAYGGKPAKCERISCDEKYKTFLGTWSGDFNSYVRELSKGSDSVFRPFKNTVRYSESDCLKNIDNNDIFIIGRREDSYPEFKSLKAETKSGLLITGKTSAGVPFLKTFDSENGLSEYSLEYQNKAANLSIWSFTFPATDKYPEMRFTTIDGQDFSSASAQKRNVTISMSIGKKEKPDWEGVVTFGSHSRKGEK